jgi:phosphatidylinositol-3-phosphatase
MARHVNRWLAATGALLLVASCSSGSGSDSGARPRARGTTTSTTGSPPAVAPVCGGTTEPPRHYTSIVVFSLENRRWQDVGGPGFGPEMPYLHALGARCSWFLQWAETDPEQNSLTQYVGQVTGAREPGIENDCLPSATCSTTADNLFRQVRNSGRVAVNYVEGATEPCSASGNAAKHIPALYLWDASDRQHCAEQVRPLPELDPAALPAFAFVTPTLCNDGHDCSNDVVDLWARDHVQPVIDSSAYKAGKVAIFIWYDEDAPVPNLWITPTAPAGPTPSDGAGAAATLRAWQSMLGVPCLQAACTAADLRSAARS